MRLEDFLDKESKKINGFAKEVGVSLGTLFNILGGKHDIRLSIAIKICRATKGVVSCEELLPKHILQSDEFKKTKKRKDN